MIIKTACGPSSAEYPSVTGMEINLKIM